MLAQPPFPCPTACTLARFNRVTLPPSMLSPSLQQLGARCSELAARCSPHMKLLPYACRGRNLVVAFRGVGIRAIGRQQRGESRPASACPSPFPGLCLPPQPPPPYFPNSCRYATRVAFVGMARALASFLSSAFLHGILITLALHMRQDARAAATSPSL